MIELSRLINDLKYALETKGNITLVIEDFDGLIYPISEITVDARHVRLIIDATKGTKNEYRD